MSFSLNIEDLQPLSRTIPSVSTALDFKDYVGAVKVRWGIHRNKYRVAPGLYKTGNPDSKSDVFVSANYKLSFDTLRKNLNGLDAWILVIDTKGVNVWCAAGKGTFSTDNIVNSIQNTSLNHLVTHRKIIVPQLGATGVAAHKVKELSGFRVIFGPVRAEYIKDFVESGYKTNRTMRTVFFTFKERVKLVPNDFMQGKYKLAVILGIFVILSGLDKTGILFSKMINASLVPLTEIFSAYISGIVITPLLLPYIPFRAFALKGAIIGLIVSSFLNLWFDTPVLENIALTGLSVAISSFVAMNFTGSSTYTSLSGVKKEMKWAIPFQITLVFLSLVLFIVTKFI